MTFFAKNFRKHLAVQNIIRTFAPAIKRYNVGAIAQLVEQRTENPCVPGSIPGGTTYKESFFGMTLFLYFTDIAQLVEQRTDIIYKLALCPRFDSWWHHKKKELLI